MFFLLVSVIVWGGGLLAFIILLFWARPERWTFKSFCLWLATCCLLYLGLMGMLSAFVRVD